MPINTTKTAILTQLKQRGALTVAQLIQYTGFSNRGIRANLTPLERTGDILLMDAFPATYQIKANHE